MWLKVWENLPRHPKARRLAALLEVHQSHAIGLLTCLWLWARQYAKDGDVSRYTPSELADAALWHGDGVRFVGALEEAGFLDPLDVGEYGHAIHDWGDYGGKDVLKAAQAAERQKGKRAKAKERTGYVPQPVLGTYHDESLVRHAADQIRQEQSREDQTTTDPLSDDERLAKDAFNRLDSWWAAMQGRAQSYSRDWEPMKEALALPGMTVDRIMRELDPIIEAKRKKGERIGAFSYCLRVLESLVLRDRVALANGFNKPVAASAKPRIEDQDHYDLLILSGIFNPADWANADEFEEVF